MTGPARRPPPVVPEIEPEAEDVPYEDMTTPELREECDRRELEYARTAKKPTLVKLLELNDNPPTEIGALLASIEKEQGEGVVTTGALVPRFTYIPIGCFLVDLAMAGGFAEACGHMIYGYEGCGKTTWWILIAAAVQRKYPEGIVAYVDVEKKFDPEWAEKLGVDLERILIIKPRSGELAVDIMEASARSIEVVCIILDSIPALAPMRIIERSAEDPTMAERARLVGLLCSKLQQAWIDEGMRGHKFTFFCINQYREKIGSKYPTNMLPGGRYQNYLVDSKLNLKKTEIMEERQGQSRHTHNEHTFKFEKTKGAFSIKSGETVMVMDDTGRKDGLETGEFDDYATVATYAKRRGLITGGGSRWSIRGVTLGEGLIRTFSKLEEIVSFLKDNREEFTRLKQLLIMIQRRESRLPDLPPDGYLFDWVSEEQEAEFVETIEAAGYGYED